MKSSGKKQIKGKKKGKVIKDESDYQVSNEEFKLPEIKVPKSKQEAWNKQQK